MSQSKQAFDETVKEELLRDIQASRDISHLYSRGRTRSQPSSLFLGRLLAKTLVENESLKEKEAASAAASQKRLQQKLDRLERRKREREGTQSTGNTESYGSTLLTSRKRQSSSMILGGRKREQHLNKRRGPCVKEPRERRHVSTSHSCNAEAESQSSPRRLSSTVRQPKVRSQLSPPLTLEAVAPACSSSSSTSAFSSPERYAKAGPPACVLRPNQDRIPVQVQQRSAVKTRAEAVGSARLDDASEEENGASERLDSGAKARAGASQKKEERNCRGRGASWYQKERRRLGSKIWPKDVYSGYTLISSDDSDYDEARRAHKRSQLQAITRHASSGNKSHETAGGKRKHKRRHLDRSGLPSKRKKRKQKMESKFSDQSEGCCLDERKEKRKKRKKDKKKHKKRQKSWQARS